MVLVPPHTSRGRPGQGGGDAGRPVAAADLAGALARDLDGALSSWWFASRTGSPLRGGHAGDAGAAQDVVQEAFLNAHRASAATPPSAPGRLRSPLAAPDRPQPLPQPLALPSRGAGIKGAAQAGGRRRKEGKAGPARGRAGQAARPACPAPVRLRAACVLKYGRELTYTEIAELLGEPVERSRPTSTAASPGCVPCLNPRPLHVVMALVDLPGFAPDPRGAACSVLAAARGARPGRSRLHGYAGLQGPVGEHRCAG